MRTSLISAAVLALLATGCGGSGGGGSSSKSTTGTGPDPTAGSITGPSSTSGTGTTSTGGTGSGPGGVHARVADYGDPSGVEQEMVELDNRARRDPTAEGKRYGIDLSSYQPRAAVSCNKFLASAAVAHTTDMAKRQFYGHVNPDGVGPNGRILASGYDLNASYGTDPKMNYSENIAAGLNALKDAKEIHQAFIVDANHNPPKHRNIILGIGTWAGCREVGYSYNSGNHASGAPYDVYIDEEYARSKTDKPFVTGVVFNDSNMSGEYDAGEGVSGVTVKLTSWDGQVVQTTTATAGGFGFEIYDNGDYTVEISGGTFGAAQSQKVTVKDLTVKVDGVVNLGVVVR